MPTVASSSVRAAEAVGKANDRKRAERSQAHDGEPDAQVGARQPGLGDESPAVVRLAEPPGHVAESRHDAELPEPRGEGGDSRADDGPVAPVMQPERVPRGYGALARISAQCCPPCPGRTPWTCRSRRRPSRHPPASDPPRQHRTMAMGAGHIPVRTGEGPDSGMLPIRVPKPQTLHIRGTRPRPPQDPFR